MPTCRGWLSAKLGQAQVNRTGARLGSQGLSLWGGLPLCKNFLQAIEGTYGLVVERISVNLLCVPSQALRLGRVFIPAKGNKYILSNVMV